MSCRNSIAAHSRAEPTELLVVDAAVPESARLLEGRRAGVEVLELEPGGRGLGQIAGRLAGRRGIAALHILSHGEPGAILLAGERIDAVSLAADADALAGIAEALAGNATVTLYGCSVAAGPAGIRFLDDLEAALGVEVAASSGPVGALALGGGWTLRGRDGTAVEPVFAPAARADYPGLLDEFTLSDGDDSVTGSDGNDIFRLLGPHHLLDSHRLDGGDGFDTLVISVDLTITLGQCLVGFEAITITAGTQVIIADHTITIDQALTVDSSQSPDTVSLDFAAEDAGTLTFIGGAGSDTVTSGDGNDTLSGGAGDDRLSAMAGDDRLQGGSGDDVLYGGSGDDVLVGGAGSDTFTGSSGDHDNDTISDFGTGDTIVVTGINLATTFNGAAASGTLALGGGSILTLTGISSTSGTFAATYDGTDTTITLVAPPVDDGGGNDLVISTSSSGGNSSQTITNTGSVTGSTAVVQNTGNSGNVVTVSLPPSVSIMSEGPSSAQSGSTAADTLIDAIDARDAPGESDAIGEAEGFLNSLSPTTPLDIRTIVPTLEPGITTGDPIVFTGSGGGQVEALVIDMRWIAGKTLEVDNIEFVSVIGPAGVTGGAGDNYAVGDDNAQSISLGAGNDTLYGGGGDDFIGSADGNDRLFGGAGNDTVLGGAEADVAYGNLDGDVVYGNQGGDTLYGGQNADIVFGGQDGDVAYGNRGDDIAYGNRGDDRLFGGQGNDLLYGGQDADTLHGNLGDDTLFGGLGADLVVVAAGGGADRIGDFDGGGGDRIQLTANANGTAIDSFAELQAAAGDSGGGVVLALGGGNALTLTGVTVDQLQSEWFVFS